MEIERKWMVGGWPAGLPLIKEQFMRQGYITVHPTVRIREEQNRVPALDGKTAADETNYIVCFKTGQGIVRKETEVSVSKEKFAELEDQIGLPLIPKLRRTYQLPNGLKLEVNHVDEGMPTELPVILTRPTSGFPNTCRMMYRKIPDPQWGHTG